jgi:hypothetical protein
MKYAIIIMSMILSLQFCSARAAEIETSPKLKFVGFIQTVAQKSENNDAFTFGMDRVRLITKANLNSKMSFKLHVDFNKVKIGDGTNQVDKDGDSPAIIKDAELGLKFKGGHQLIMGKMKTPIGYEFNFPGFKLDVVKRGFGHQNMVFERAMGMMFKSAKFGAMKTNFKLGVFNAGPSKANDTGSAAEGQDYTISGAVYLNPLANLTANASFGSAGTSIEGQEPVTMFAGALDYRTDKIRTVLDFISRDDPDHTSNDGMTYYAMAGYKINPGIEVVLRHETLDVENDAKDRADFVAGVNFYFNPKKTWESKVMINYVSSDMDGSSGLQLMFQGVF